MTAIRRALLAGVAAIVFAAACTSISIPSIPPIPSLPPGATIPPLPSIAIPSIAIPSLDIPSIEIPSIEIPSIEIPSLDIPSIDLPTAPPVGDSLCALVTAEELAAIFGGAPTIAPGSAGECNITPPNEIIPITARVGEGESIAVGRQIVTNPQDLTVGGFPALYGEFMGGILYVEKNGRTLVVQAAIQEDKQEESVAIAEAMIDGF